MGVGVKLGPVMLKGISMWKRGAQARPGKNLVDLEFLPNFLNNVDPRAPSLPPIRGAGLRADRLCVRSRKRL